MYGAYMGHIWGIKNPRIVKYGDSSVISVVLLIYSISSDLVTSGAGSLFMVTLILFVCQYLFKIFLLYPLMLPPDP